MRSKVGEGASETGPAPGLRQLDNRIRRKTGKNASLAMMEIIYLSKKDHIACAKGAYLKRWNDEGAICRAACGHAQRDVTRHLLRRMMNDVKVVAKRCGSI